MGLFDSPSFIIAQMIGFIAFTIAISRYQMPDKRGIMQLNSIASGLFAIQYLFMGVGIGFAMASAGAMRSAILSTGAGQKCKWLVIPPLLISASITAFMFRENNWMLFLVVTPYFVAYAEMLGCDFKTRKMSMFSDFMWLIYGACNGSIGAVLATSTGLMSGAVGIVRYNMPDFRLSLRPALPVIFLRS
jgi:hypothetical protein